MRITLNEQNRKPLVKLVSEFTGEEARYLFTPTYAFQIGSYIVTREGNIDTPEGVDADTLQRFVETLITAGYQPEMPESPAEETAVKAYKSTDGDDAEETSAIETQAEATAEESSDTEKPEALAADIALTISVPLGKVNVGNLTRLLDAKGSLIRKALGIPATPIEITEDAVLFPWFSQPMDADTSRACTDFISALCTMSMTQKRVTAKEKEVSNKKFAFRCFLLRLGFIGPDFKTDRKILLQNLSGSSAFKNGSRNTTKGCDQNEEA